MADGGQCYDVLQHNYYALFQIFLSVLSDVFASYYLTFIILTSHVVERVRILQKHYNYHILYTIVHSFLFLIIICITNDGNLAFKILLCK